MVLLPEPDLRGDDATLVVNPHQGAQEKVEDYPCDKECSHERPCPRQLYGGKHERDNGKEEARFLVRNKGEERASGNNGEEGERGLARAVEEEGDRWSKEEGDGSNEVLVVGVKAVEGEVRA